MWKKRILASQLFHMPNRCGKRNGGESVRRVELPPSDNLQSYQQFRQLNEIIVNSGSDNRPHAVIKIMGQPFIALLDSGANCSLLGGRNVHLVGHLGLQVENINAGIKTADGTPHKINSFTRIPITYNNRSEQIRVLLIPTLPDCIILGMDFWEKFGVKAVCHALEMNENKSTTCETLIKLL